jgi:hypothetical protein
MPQEEEPFGLPKWMFYIGAVWLGLMMWVLVAVPPSGYIAEFVLLLLGFLFTPAYAFAAYWKWRRGWLKWLFAALAVLSSALNLSIALTFIG